MIKKKVMIVDIVVMENEKVNEENSKSLETQLFLDMLMMVVLTGRERREEEWAKLFCEAGFSDYKIIPILDLRSLIEKLASALAEELFRGMEELKFNLPRMRWLMLELKLRW
ncbi:hypothetical protein V6N11_044967 [Hibiscus sabdariffa]|uniref:O-methyltransferase C-terminal domain-containing protein n=1 Tax=Hibiscus sabdariffa TaxID=183260 RepID=A0ABR2PUE6_9ROSI